MDGCSSADDDGSRVNYLGVDRTCSHIGLKKRNNNQMLLSWMYFHFFFFFVDCFQQIVLILILNVFNLGEKNLKPIKSAHKEKHSYILHYLSCFFLYVMHSWPD